MEDIQQTTGVVDTTPATSTVAPAAAPKAEVTTVAQPTTTAAETKAKPTEMSKEQKELYNQTLRNISKTAHSQLKERYNAFEDNEIKAKVKEEILAGKTPKADTLAKSVVSRVAPSIKQSVKSPTTTDAATKELLELKAEVALMRAGVKADRIDAAKRLFVAEGGKIEKINDFVAKYPEWKANSQDGDVSFAKAQPLGQKTAPTPSTRPTMNDFERKVAEMRKRRGLE